MEAITRDEKLMDGQYVEPITRKEKILAGEDLETITREEYFLKKYRGGGGGDITVESLNVTENGTYTAPTGKAYSPVNVNVQPELITKTITANGTYNASSDDADGYSSVTVNVQGYAKKSISNTPTDIATFNASALPMPSLTVGIEAVQDLHGYDYPWPAGGGKNKLQVTATSQTIAGVTVTVKDDGTFIANGTATQNISLQLSRKNVNGTPLPEGQLIMTGCPSGGSTSSYYLACWRTNSGNANDVGNGISFAYQSDWDFVVSLVITSGTTCNNLTFEPMIRLASVTDATFAPYENICPIEGWTEEVITRTGKNLLNPTIRKYSSPFVVYGGTIASNVPDGSLVLKAGTYTISTNERMYTIEVRDNPNNTIATGQGDSLTFTLEEEKAVKIAFNKGSADIDSLTFQIEEGSTATTYEPYNGRTYTINLGGTRYGCTLDVVSGVLAVDRAIRLVSDCTWQGSNGGFYTNSVASSVKHGDGRFDHVVSNVYKTENVGSITPLSNGGISVDADGYIQLKDSRYSTASDFKTNMGTTQLVYELATPLTIQLTPTAISTQDGTNNLWADTGDIQSGEYMEAL